MQYTKELNNYQHIYRNISNKMSDNLLKEEILRIDQLMNYKRSKTLLEQGGDPQWARNIGRSGWTNPATGTKVPGNYGDDSMFGAEEADALIDFITDPHFLLPVAAIVLSVASFGAGTPLAAGLLAGGGIALEVADAALYWKEGEYANAGMAAIFALIPAGQLARMLGLRFVSEMTELEIKQFLRKIDDGVKLTEKETQLAEAIVKNEVELTRFMLKKASRALSVKLLSEYSGIKLWSIALELAKAGLLSWRTTYKITKLTGSLAGIYTLGEIGSFLGDETAKSLGYKVPTEFEKNRDEVYKALIDQADDSLKPQLEETLDQLSSVDDQEKQERLTKVLKDIDKKLSEL